METKKINSSLLKILQELINKQPLVKNIIQAIGQAGGTALLVGGAVRDLILGLPVKDLDIEVHGISIDQLEEILKWFGPVSLIGKSFGVLRLHGLDIDWSLPRADTAGRKPKVIIDEHMNIKDAMQRRDLTMNAMAINLHTFELLDPFHGMNDLKKGVLRVPDAKLFIEDPLRLFRVMQFIGRFEMIPDHELNEICATMSIKGISTERIESEFDKLLLKSKRPSLGIRWLEKIGRLPEILPELADTIHIPQEPDWHPEGNVFEHTMQALDAAAAIVCENEQEKLTLLYATLCHDLGKTITTQKVNGRWVSYEHEIKGIPLAKQMLHRLTRRVELIDAVSKLVQYHMAPGTFVDQGAKPPAYKRLANKLAPEVTISLLAKLALADKRGRNPSGHQPLQTDFAEITEFLEKAEAAQVAIKPEEPVLQGRDLFDKIEPGPEMGKLLKKAYEIQIEEGIKDKQELLKRILP